MKFSAVVKRNLRSKVIIINAKKSKILQVRRTKEKIGSILYATGRF
jgi:hypothetical protein